MTTTPDDVAEDVRGAEAALRQDPASVEARLALARLLKPADPVRAAAVLDDAPAEVDATYAYRALVVRFFIETGDHRAAEEALAGLRAIDDGRPETGRIAGQLAEADARFAEAAAHYRAILATHFDPLWCRQSLARVLLAAGDAEGAAETLLADTDQLERHSLPLRQTLTTLVDRGPAAARATLDTLAEEAALPDLEAEMRMALAWRLKDRAADEAVDILASRAALARQSPGYADLLVGLLVGAQRLDEAWAHLAEFAPVHDAPFVHRRRGQVAEARGDLSTALAAFTAGAAAHPEEDDLAFHAARLEIELSPSEPLFARLAASPHARDNQLAFDHRLPRGEFEAADAQLAQFEARHGVRNRERASLFGAMGRWADARTALRALLEADPDNADLIGECARAEAHLDVAGSLAEGIARLKALAPSPASLRQLVSLEAMAGEARAAVASAQALLARSNAMPDRLTRIRTLIDAADFEAAREALVALEESLPPGASRLPLALLRAEIGDVEEAIALLGGERGAQARFERLKLLAAAGRIDDAHRELLEWHPAVPAEVAARTEAAALVHLETFDFAGALRHALTGLYRFPGNAAFRLLEQRALVGLCRGREARWSIIGESGDLDARHLPKEVLYSFFGSMINEMLAREEEHLAVARSLCAEPEIALQMLADVVRSGADLTAAATGFAAMLRRAGRLPTALLPAPAWPEAIPRRIHQYWDRGDPPADVLALHARLAALHPACETRLWNAREAKAMLAANFEPVVARAFGAARDPAVRADLFRFAILSREGGVSVDGDSWCRAPLDPLLTGEATFVAHQNDLGAIDTNLVAAAPGHPILTAALEGTVEALQSGSAEFPWLLSGPGRFTREVAAHIAAQPDLAAPDVAIWPQHLAAEVLSMHRMTSHKKAARFRRAATAPAGS